MVLGGAAVSVKDHSDPEALAPHGLHKLEVALGDVLPCEVCLPSDVVQEPPTTLWYENGFV